MKITTSLLLSLVLFFVLIAGASSVKARDLVSPGVGDGETLAPVVGESSHFDLSPALRSIPVESLQQSNSEKSHAVLLLPKALGQTSFESQEMKTADPVLQNNLGSGSIPEPINSFDGVGNENLVLPPDTEGDIGFDPANGRKYYVQWVNLSFAIWDVTGAPTKIYGPVSGNTLWKGFGGPCENTNHGDPITLFDPLAQRWLMSQFSVDGPFYQCIAISQTGDPTGAWFRYSFLISSTKMNDYPHFGVWPDGYYMTINQFNLDNSWGGTGVVVFNRDKMLAGQQASFQYFDLFSVDSDFGGMLPADLDGLTPPPAGAPNYFLEVDDASWIGPQDALRLWKFHVDWDNPSNTTFGIAGQPDAILPTAPWTPLCEGVIACIPQPGTSARVDAIGDRLMYRLAYRNFGDHESLVVNHTVDVGSGQAGVRWYEVRDPGGLPVLYQQGTFAPDLNNRWMGSIAQDRMGDIALGYSISSSSLYPSVRYTGRLAGDPTGLMTQGEATLVAGGGSQTHASSRWGDYSLLSVDPVDDCTFWYTQEYYAVTNPSDWKTRIGSFRFPGCSDANPGKIIGEISDLSSGLPIPGAKVKAASSSGTDYQTISGADGRYNLLLATGQYGVSASAYGYFSQFLPGVQITAGVTTTLDFSLNATEKYTVSGVVKDGRTGWPLYAQITISGDPMDPPAPYNQVWTDPITGQYTATLAAGSDYLFQVESFSPGYLPESYQTGILTGNQSHDFMLAVDPVTCSAPGYTLHSQGYSQPFNTAEIPSGWGLADNTGSGATWRFDNPKPRPNYTGGSGNFAIIDSDFEGPVPVDAVLLSPSFNLTSYPTATVEFKYDFNWYEYGEDEQADVDLSVDGGSNWTNIWQRSGAGDRGPKTARLDISSLAGGKSNVQLRFHYYQANFEWWWEVDDFFVGRQSCDPEPGGLVVGEVNDANTELGLPGAVVSSDSGGNTPTVASLDPRLSGAVYTLFSPAGSHIFTATAGTQYGAVVKPVDVVADQITGLDFSLPAGWIQAFPDHLDVTVKAGLTTTQVITLSNQGGLGANFQISEANASLNFAGTVGPFAPAERRVSPAHLYDPDARSVRVYQPPEVPVLPGGEVLEAWNSGLPGAWGIAYDTSRENLWVGDIGILKGDDWDHSFLPDGTIVGGRIDTMPWGGVFAADMAYDPLRDRIWQVVVGSENCIYEWDPRAQTSTGNKICPDLGVSMRGLAYDPVTETFYSGSWNDQILYHFDVTGKLLDSSDVRLNISGLAFNPLSGHLFVLSNAGIGFDIYLIDVNHGYAPLGGFDIPGMGAFEQAGLALDCSGDLWAVNQSSGLVIVVTSGETGVCSWNEIPWLSVSPVSGNLEPGGQQPLSLNFDAGALSSGVYPAFLRVSSNTPYSPLDLPVTMTVRLDYDFSISPQTAEKSGAPGEQVTFSLQVENTGLQPDEYKIELQDSQWSTQIPLTIGPLEPGQTAMLPVTVTVPLDVSCNTRDDFSVVLISTNDPNRTASAFLGASSNLVCGVELSPASSILTGGPGQEVLHTLELTNTGNITDTFSLSSENNSPGWQVIFSPDLAEEITLAASAKAVIHVQVTIPPGALVSQANIVTIAATSGGDTSRFATTTLTTVLNGSHFFLPFIPYR